MTNRADDVERELAGLLAREMVKPVASNAIVLQKHRVDDSPNPLGFLTSISTAFANEVSAISPPPSYLVVLSSSASSQNPSTSTVVMVLGSDEKKVKEVGDVLKNKLSVKGGGKGTRWSGKFTGVWLENREGAIVQEALSA